MASNDDFNSQSMAMSDSLSNALCLAEGFFEQQTSFSTFTSEETTNKQQKLPRLQHQQAQQSQILPFRIVTCLKISLIVICISIIPGITIFLFAQGFFWGGLLFISLVFTAFIIFIITARLSRTNLI